MASGLTVRQTVLPPSDGGSPQPELYENDLAEDATIDTRRFDSALFRDAAVDPDTAKLNAGIIQYLAGEPEWWIVGAEATRAAELQQLDPAVGDSRPRPLHPTANLAISHRLLAAPPGWIGEAGLKEQRTGLREKAAEVLSRPPCSGHLQARAGITHRAASV
jgi:hypothetical protein